MLAFGLQVLTESTSGLVSVAGCKSGWAETYGARIAASLVQGCRPGFCPSRHDLNEAPPKNDWRVLTNTLPLARLNTRLAWDGPALLRRAGTDALERCLEETTSLTLGCATEFGQELA